MIQDKSSKEKEKWLINKHWLLFGRNFKRQFEDKGYEIDDFSSAEFTNLKRGAFITYLSRITSKTKKYGLIYQICLGTPRRPLTHDLGVPQSELQYKFSQASKKELSSYIVITDISTSIYDGVSVDSFKLIEKIRNIDNPRLIMSLVILPKSIDEEVMKFYNDKMRNVEGSTTTENSVERIVKYLL